MTTIVAIILATVVTIITLSALLSMARAHVAELRAALTLAYTDQAYGCLTRAGGAAIIKTLSSDQAVIFLDLDDMHNCNERFGYAGVDGRIRAALSGMRHDDVVIARWYSGDEIILVVPITDAAGLAHRLQSLLVANDLSATFGVTTASTDLVTSVEKCMSMVQTAKAANRRGTISIG